MQRKFEQLKANLATFVDQREHSTLVLHCANDALSYALTYLKSIDEERDDLFILSFAHSAITAKDYFAGAMETMRLQRTAINEAQALSGVPLWPEFPAACDDSRLRHQDRIGALLTFLREQVGDPRQLFVLAFVPLEIEDQIAYARFAGELLPQGAPAAWMRNTRVILRDDRERPFILPTLQKNPREGVLVYDMDFSSAALAASLVDDAADKTLPTDRRAQAFLQLAMLDSAHRRFEDALSKYSFVFPYFVEQRNIAMQAICLQGVGDVLHRVERLEGAKERFQQALALASQTQSPTLILTALLSLGRVSLQLKDYGHAEGYWDFAQQFAAKCGDVHVTCDAMEQLGVARMCLGREPEAAATWQAATELCKQAQYFDRWASLLERLIPLYGAARMGPKQREAKTLLAAISERQKGHP